MCNVHKLVTAKSDATSLGLSSLERPDGLTLSMA